MGKSPIGALTGSYGIHPVGKSGDYMIELLKKLNADLTFRPDEGPFRDRLVELAIENTIDECTELFSARNCDIQVSFSSLTFELSGIRFHVESDLGEQALKCSISSLSDEEVSDLTEQLTRLGEKKFQQTGQEKQKIIIRKKVVDGKLRAHQAAQMLKCSEIFFKNNIPCTEYTYREINGKKEITGYFWSPELIDRLCNIKAKGPQEEDIQYIAQECCDGDCEWAKDILSMLGISSFNANGRNDFSQNTANRQNKISKVVTNNRGKKKRLP